MKLNYILLLCFMLVGYALPVTGQTDDSDCTQSNAQIDLDVNNVRARLLGGGDMWWDLSDGRYIVPQITSSSQEVSAVFAAGLWMGGYDAAGNLKMAAQTYRQQGNDFWSGPINDEGTTDQATCQQWDRHWKINLGDVFDHIADYADNGQIDDEIPNSIKGWPGRGNPFFAEVNGFEMPLREFAPFEDINGDGIYNPQDGDYPGIKGDQSIWWMYNDVGNSHSETGGATIGLEVGVLAYAFNSTSPPSLDNTTFYEYTIINKSNETIFDYYIGVWADVDLGCYDNDYVGCDVDRQMGFVYNGEATDPNCNGVNGYGNDVPMLGIQMLRTPTDAAGVPSPFSSFVAYNNSFPPGSPTPTTNPQETQHYYNFLQGVWLDGSPIEYGGDGYNEGTYPVTHMFTSNPQDNSSDAWSECSANNDPGDRRFVMSVGPSELQPGDIKHLVFSVVWTPDVPHPCPNLGALQDAADEIRGFYEQELVAVQTPIHPTANVSIMPNPMTNQAVLNVESQDKIRNIELHAANGRLLRTYNNVDNQTNQIIERGTLPTGVYFYTVNFDNGLMKSGKIVMQ